MCAYLLSDWSSAALYEGLTLLRALPSTGLPYSGSLGRLLLASRVGYHLDDVAHHRRSGAQKSPNAWLCAACRTDRERGGCAGVLGRSRPGPAPTKWHRPSAGHKAAAGLFARGRMSSGGTLLSERLPRCEWAHSGYELSGTAPLAERKLDSRIDLLSHFSPLVDTLRHHRVPCKANHKHTARMC